MQRSLYAVMAVAMTFIASVGVSQDECSTAVPVATGSNPPACGTFTNVGATTSAGYPAICNTISSDLWYSFTPSTTGAYQIDTNTPAGCTAGTETDTVLAVYGSCAPGIAPIICDDDSGTGLLSQLTVGLCANTTYYIRVGSFGAQSATNNGTFRLNINPNTTTFTEIVCSPAPGCAQVNLVNGPAGGNYFFAFTTNGTPFPGGWFYGISPSLQELNNLMNTGAPFVGTLDAMGNAVVGQACGLSGFTFYSVGLATSGALGVPTLATAPVAYTIP